MRLTARRAILSGVLAALIALGAAPTASGTAQAEGWGGEWIQETYFHGDKELTWIQWNDQVTGSVWIEPWGAGLAELQFTGTAAGLVVTGTWTAAPQESLDPEWLAGGTRTFELTLDAEQISWEATFSWSSDDGTSSMNAYARGIRGEDPTGTPPEVVAYRFNGFAKPATRISLNFRVKDDSGRATAKLTLYEGGKAYKRGVYKGKATGKKKAWKNVLLAADLKGPLYFCLWAQDAAGTKSVGAPRSSCTWVKLVVDIARVSNGCGGKGWEDLEAIENTFGNTSTYYGEDGTPYVVDFTEACNLHDAGYGGYAVYDRFSGEKVSFHDWSRSEIDAKFARDMATLCEDRIPAEETAARAECASNFRFATVRTFGGLFFDADLRSIGTQDEGHRGND